MEFELGFSVRNLRVSDERSELKDFEEMTTSEVSIKGNCVNGRGDNFSSGYSEPNVARNTMEGQNGHSTRPAPVRG